MAAIVSSIAMTMTGCATDPSDDVGQDAGDGDGDATEGDGDGDPTGTEDPSTGDGDGDGDPTGDGDGDGDPSTGDGDGDPSTGDGDGDIELPNVDGVYLFAIETSLGPDLPLQFVTTVSNLTIDGPIATADFSFQPLSLDQGATTSPREFVGEPLAYTGVIFDAAGEFELDMGEVMVSGAANPITGSDIVADLTVLGGIVHVDAMCGQLEGDLLEPLEFDLMGSTFAAIRLTDDGSDPATLPLMFPYDCGAVPPAP